MAHSLGVIYGVDLVKAFQESYFVRRGGGTDTEIVGTFVSAYTVLIIREML